MVNLNEKQHKQLLEALEDIKGLLALLAIKNKATQQEVARVLRMDDRGIRRILSGR